MLQLNRESVVKKQQLRCSNKLTYDGAQLACTVRRFYDIEKTCKYELNSHGAEINIKLYYTYIGELKLEDAG